MDARGPATTTSARSRASRRPRMEPAAAAVTVEAVAPVSSASRQAATRRPRSARSSPERSAPPSSRVATPRPSATDVSSSGGSQGARSTTPGERADANAAEARSRPASRPTAATSANSATQGCRADRERGPHRPAARAAHRRTVWDPVSPTGGCRPPRPAESPRPPPSPRPHEEGERHQGRRDGHDGAERHTAAASGTSSTRRSRPGPATRPPRPTLTARTTCTEPGSPGCGTTTPSALTCRTAPSTRDVDDDPDRLAQLGVDGRPRHPRQGAQRLEPRRHLLGPVGVHRAHASLVPGVEGGEELTDLRPADLADDEAVGTHPQGLPDEVDEGHAADALDVGSPALEPDHVRVPGVELADVLDDDDALVHGALRQQPREDRRLADPRATGDDEGHARRDDGPQGRHELGAHGTEPVQLVDPGGSVPREPQADVRRGVDERGQHRVEPGPAGQHAVDPRLRVVEPAPRDPREADRQRPQLVDVQPDPSPLHAVAAVHPHLPVPVDEEVGDRGVRRQGRQGPESDELLDHRPGGVRDPLGPEDARLLRGHPRNDVCARGRSRADRALHGGRERPRHAAHDASARPSTAPTTTSAQRRTASRATPGNSPRSASRGTRASSARWCRWPTPRCATTSSTTSSGGRGPRVTTRTSGPPDRGRAGLEEPGHRGVGVGERPGAQGRDEDDERVERQHVLEHRARGREVEHEARRAPGQRGEHVAHRRPRQVRGRAAARRQHVAPVLLRQDRQQALRQRPCPARGAGRPTAGRGGARRRR